MKHFFDYKWVKKPEITVNHLLIFFSLTRYERSKLLFCAELKSKETMKNFKSDLCLVDANQTVANFLEPERSSDSGNTGTEQMVQDIYKKSCLFDEDLHILQSVKVVRASSECQSHVISSRAMSIISIIDIKHKISGFTLAGLGLLGNFIAMTVYLSPDYLEQYHIGVYFFTKALFEVGLLINQIIHLANLGNTSYNGEIIGKYVAWHQSLCPTEGQSRDF